MSKHLISVSKAAQLVKITQHQMRSSIRESKISVQKTECGNWKIDKTEFHQLLSEISNTSLDIDKTEDGASIIVSSLNLIINEKLNTSLN